MKKVLASAALAGVLAAGMSAAPTADANAKEKKEKCYGIAKAGANDCASANGSHSCAAQSTQDNDINEFVFVDQGTCHDKGGKLKSEIKNEG